VKTRTVFVVDDDQEQADLLAEALAAEGVRVRAFSDPIRALATLGADGSDLLVADMSMPWMDGMDVIASARLKQPHIKVILISGYDHAAELAQKHGLPFFKKPVDLPALRRAVEDALR
jgi:DNA-binding NtrC family response regulator